MLDPIFIDEVSRPWDQQDNEPKEWYNIFLKYYLPLGEKRSLRNAFEFFIRAENPQQYEHVDPDNFQYTPIHWNQYAREFRWAERAMAYDKEKRVDFAQLYVNQVLEYLQANSMDAAKSLVSALKSERSRVPAANSILNRIGVPESTEIQLRMGVNISSDEMAEASNKVNEWKTRKLSG